MRLGWCALVVATLAATLVFALVLRDAVQAARSPSAYAAPRSPDPAGRTYQNGNTNDNAVDADNTEDADTEDGDNDDRDNDEDFDNEDFDNEADVDIGLDLPPASPTRQPAPVCSTPGQDTVFTSFDGKVSVRIPGSSPRPVQVQLYLVINAYEAPAPPGIPIYTLVYEIKASSCDADPLAASPAEAALAIRYTDIEVEGLDENRFVIGRLDMTTATWVPLEQHAHDPAANVVAATITETGYYMVWEGR